MAHMGVSGGFCLGGQAISFPIFKNFYNSKHRFERLCVKEIEQAGADFSHAPMQLISLDLDKKTETVFSFSNLG